MKALVGAFNQEKVLVGAFSVIVKPMDHYTALVGTHSSHAPTCSLLSSRGRLFQVLFSFLDTFSAGMIETPVSSGLLLSARNLDLDINLMMKIILSSCLHLHLLMVTSSLSSRSSLSKVWLLMAEPGHRRDWR